MVATLMLRLYPPGRAEGDLDGPADAVANETEAERVAGLAQGHRVRDLRGGVHARAVDADDRVAADGRSPPPTLTT